MYLIVIGWMYVVLMMSVTEETIVAGVMTFLLYGVLPVSLIVYLGGGRRRRQRRQQQAAAADAGTANEVIAEVTAPENVPSAEARHSGKPPSTS